MTLLKEIIVNSKDMTCLKFLFVNIFILGNKNSWFLIDTGLKGTGHYIFAALSKLGFTSPPKAVIITHAHFEHIGALKEIMQKWKVPVYVHEKEIPFLCEQIEGIDEFKTYIKALPEDGTIPNIPGWKWLSTPGHTVGHVSLFNTGNKCLIAGDALSSINQKPLKKTSIEKPEYTYYFKPNWNTAKTSARFLATLNPEVIAHSHGQPVGEGNIDFEKLLKKFDSNIVKASMPCKTLGRPKKIITASL